MISTNAILLASLILTTSASFYNNYSQSEIIKNQQFHILELEKFKHGNKLEIIKANAEVSRFNEHCNKIESAIKVLIDVEYKNKSSKYTPNDTLLAWNYLYLLPLEKKLKTTENIKYKKTDIGLMNSQLQYEYQKCITMRSTRTRKKTRAR